MPTHLQGIFTVEELQDIQLAEPFSVPNGCRTMMNAPRAWSTPAPFETLLFDLVADPRQEHPLQDRAVEERMIAHMMRLMRESDAPPEQYERLGLPEPVLGG